MRIQTAHSPKIVVCTMGTTTTRSPSSVFATTTLPVTTRKTTTMKFYSGNNIKLLPQLVQIVFVFVVAAVCSSSVLLVAAQVCTADGQQCDTHERCAVWKEDGECIRARAYMKKHCPASCEGVVAAVSEAASSAEPDCVDLHAHCPQWATLGECSESDDMLKYCALSCGVCDADENDDSSWCKDLEENCKFWETHGECAKNPDYMSKNCAVSCKTCDQLPSSPLKQTKGSGNTKETDDQRRSAQFGTLQIVKGAQSAATAARLTESLAYMESDAVTSLDAPIRSSCQNRNELCTFWGVIGECEKNAAYMKTNCAPACMTCHLIDIQKRCPKLGDDVDPAWHPGDLNRMFERILRLAPGNRTTADGDGNTVEGEEELAATSTTTPLYTAHVHSRPDASTEISAALDKSMPPWVITLDDFLTAEECATMIQLGYESGYERSMDVGGEKFDGSHEAIQSERRTSENAWCSESKNCRTHEVPTRIHNRMSSVMGIPPENSEDLQILKYEKGQF